jgi:TetR/AcrR family transcriptional regulator, cholesterol catabolism regulator
MPVASPFAAANVSCFRYWIPRGRPRLLAAEQSGKKLSRQRSVRHLIYSNERSICMTGATSSSSRRAKPKTVAPLPGDTRFDRRLAEILGHATEVFCRKGYSAASMRDLSRATGMSLAGLYYYFDSKEKLLYLIQKHTFRTILDRLHERLQNVTDPEQRLRIFILNHLEYFLANQKGMKLLSHENEALRANFGDEILAIKRQYYRMCREMVEALKAERGLEFPTRVAVLSLFGMMNWIYTWHNPRVDADAQELAGRMSDIFLRGVLGESKPNRESEALPAGGKSAPRARRSASSNI